MALTTVTIVTACYNSGQLIERTYASLVNQQVKPLEWVIVDDASRDDTPERLSTLAAGAPFDIVVIRNATNLGAVHSIRKGIEQARGDFTLILDHDDELVPEGLARLCGYWDQQGTPGYSGVGARCVDQTGALLSPPFPCSPLVTNELHLRHVLRIRGELTGMVKTSLLLQFYQPDALGRTNGLTWRRIARRYDAIYVNDVVRVYHTNVAGSMVNTPRITRPDLTFQATVADLRENADYAWVDPWYFWRQALLCATSAVYAGAGLSACWRELASAVPRLCLLLALPAVPIAMARDRWLKRV